MATAQEYDSASWERLYSLHYHLILSWVKKYAILITGSDCENPSLSYFCALKLPKTQIASVVHKSCANNRPGPMARKEYRQDTKREQRCLQGLKDQERLTFPPFTGPFLWYCPERHSILPLEFRIGRWHIIVFTCRIWGVSLYKTHNSFILIMHR